jgi:uncharacterized protein (TIGR03435 family)
MAPRRPVNPGASPASLIQQTMTTRLPWLLFPALISPALTQPPEPQPAFDVATIKPIGRDGTEGRRRENIQSSPDRLTMTNVSLKAAIRWAYGVLDYQVSGPGWLAGNRFDIQAKTAAAASEPQLRAMLQTLLADRFKVQVHHATRELSVYALVVAKDGPKFHESEAGGESSIEPNPKEMKLVVHRTPVSQLVEMLSNIAQLPVVDLTGLTGRYDITIDLSKYILDRSGNEPLDPMTLIMRGLQDELGLKLDSRRMPIDLVVVDAAERAPTEN